MPAQPAIAALPRWSLEEALAAIARVFDSDELAGRDIALDDVAEYYRQSDRGYRLFHSGEGALHIALGGDGHHDTACYARQAELFAEHMKAIGGERAIEFGCGMGYNTRWLARNLPSCEVLGVDLTESHIDYCRGQSMHQPNLRYEVGNYEKLDCDDAAFAGVLAVETFCQTDSMSNALAEAWRVLKPGGRLVVIDCFRGGPLTDFAPGEQRAARLVEKTTAVDSFAEISEWITLCESLGFKLVEAMDRSAETAQNLRRLHGLAVRFFKLPRAVRALSQAFPRRLLENAACGLLMPYTVGCGVHVYYSIALEKPKS